MRGKSATPLGQTPLQLAAQGGHEESVRLLLDARASVGVGAAGMGVVGALDCGRHLIRNLIMTMFVQDSARSTWIKSTANILRSCFKTVSLSSQQKR